MTHPSPSRSPTASSGAPPPPRTRSRATTSTATGGVKEHTAGDATSQEPSLDACDSYHRWPEDMDLLAGRSASPTTGSASSGPVSSPSAALSRAPRLAHYRRMVEGALDRGLRPDGDAAPLHGAAVVRGARRLDRRRRGRPVRPLRRGLRAGDRRGRTARLHDQRAEHDRRDGGPGQARRHRLPARPACPPPTTRPPRRSSPPTTRPSRRSGRWTRASRSAGPSPTRSTRRSPGAEDVTAAYRHPREDVFIEAARGDDWIGVQSYTRTRIGAGRPDPGGRRRRAHPHPVGVLPDRGRRGAAPHGRVGRATSR